MRERDSATLAEIMAKSGSKAIIPAGYLSWGLTHSFSPDFGTLMHVTQESGDIYTGGVKGNKWEIRRWEPATAQCAPFLKIIVRDFTLYPNHLIYSNVCRL